MKDKYSTLWENVFSQSDLSGMNDLENISSEEIVRRWTLAALDLIKSHNYRFTPKECRKGHDDYNKYRRARGWQPINRQWDFESERQRVEHN